LSTLLTPKRLAGRLAIVALSALVFAFCASSATAVPANPTIKDKQAARQAILTEIDVMKQNLAIKMDDLTQTTSKIQDTQKQVDDLNKQLAATRSSLQSSHTQLNDRAAALYRSDRLGMVEILLGSRSIGDLIVRTHYLLLISEHDARMLDDYRRAQQENTWVQDSLSRQMDNLRGLQDRSTAEIASINAEMTAAEQRALQIDADIAALMQPVAPPPPPSAVQTNTGTSPQVGTQTSPDYNTLISSTNFRSQDMTAGAIQTFLSKQSGTLANYSVANYNGQTKTAADIIWEAAQAWNISPRVILVTLEKEQSLLSMSSPEQKRYDWAMGCGVPDSGGHNMKYYGFGNQIWYGAKTLDANAKRWRPGMSILVGTSNRVPTNSATFSFYRYTPHIHGNFNFWILWWRYFGTNPTGPVPPL
jgi:peptidoglycan hydrolase CwlO-like protein